MFSLAIGSTEMGFCILVCLCGFFLWKKLICFSFLHFPTNQTKSNTLDEEDKVEPNQRPKGPKQDGDRVICKVSIKWKPHICLGLLIAEKLWKRKKVKVTFVLVFPFVLMFGGFLCCPLNIVCYIVRASPYILEA